jgi:CheY-like chemotaxis protein
VFMSALSGLPRLLIVEDDQDTRDILKTILNEEGYAVTLAESVQEAMALLDEEVFYFVLTDLFADKAEESLQSVVALGAHAQPTPIGVMTGWKLSQEEVRRAGFACLVKKPFDLNDLLTTIAACLQIPLTPAQQRQAEVVERFYAALNARDWEGALALCAVRLVYFPASGSLYAPTRKLTGRGAYQAYVQDVFERLSLTRFEDVLLYASPKGLAARYSYGVTLPDGTPERRAGASVFRFHGALIAQIGMKVRRERPGRGRGSGVALETLLLVPKE